MEREYLILHMIALTAAILLDYIIGDPHWLPHPVRLIGRLISALEKVLYKDGAGKRQQMIRGFLLWIITVLLSGGAVAVIEYFSFRISPCLFGVVETVLAFYFLAAGSLRDESMKVYKDLASGDIAGARADLSMIVGRDTDKLDRGAITRAAVETVSENTSDGVVAPLIFVAALGPIGGMVYKAINTMDSMIGYRNVRYEYFGKFAARADDIANLVPARISAVFMIAAAFFLRQFSKDYRPLSAAGIWKRDRYKHNSPNSAQTESVCAGALGVRLGGSSTYGGRRVDKPFIGDDVRAIETEDIRRAIRLMFATEALCTAVLIIILIILI